MAKVLIIEDEKAMSDLIAIKFKVDGFEVDQAFSLAEAKQKLTTQKYDAVLSDYLLPDGNSLDLFTEVKPQLGGLPIVLATNYIEDLSQDKAKSLGISEVIVKYQVVPAQMVEKIKALIGNAGVFSPIPENGGVNPLPVSPVVASAQVPPTPNQNTPQQPTIEPVVQPQPAAPATTSAAPVAPAESPAPAPVSQPAITPAPIVPVTLDPQSMSTPMPGIVVPAEPVTPPSAPAAAPVTLSDPAMPADTTQNAPQTANNQPSAAEPSPTNPWANPPTNDSSKP